MPATIEVLGQYLDHFVADGYNFTIYKYEFTDQITIKLSKRTTGGSTVEVTGAGTTFAEAFAQALDNFPTLPGTGGWLKPKLPKPAPIIQGAHGEPGDQ